MLHPGLYEQIISKAMDCALASTDRRSQTAPIDPAEASKVLAQYVAEVVERGLETLRDRGGDLHAQVALTNRLIDKGLKPNGVYVRQGSSSVPASHELIRQMIKESDGGLFEEMRSLEQSLSFETAASAFKRFGVAFSPENYRALGITRKTDGGCTRILHASFPINAHTQPRSQYSETTATRCSKITENSAAPSSGSLRIPSII